METAKAWHLTPGQWRVVNRDDQAMMMAHELITGIRAAYKADKDEAEMANKGKGPSDFEKMKQLMSKPK